MRTADKFPNTAANMMDSNMLHSHSPFIRLGTQSDKLHNISQNTERNVKT